MNPEQRKEASELQLHKLGMRINVQLHVIESDEEVTLRCQTEVLHRLLALWAVSSAALAREVKPFRNYLQQHQLEHVLSQQEHLFLFAETPSEQDFAVFTERQEALYFLAWSAGLSDKIGIPKTASNLKQILKLFPQALEAPERLIQAMKLRSKGKLLDWSDLLYRLHWEVRHCQLTGRASPASINPQMVRQWHQAVNWICQYEEENDWDLVSTET